MSNVSHFRFDNYCGLKHFRRFDPSILLLFCRIWVVLTVGHQLPRVSLHTVHQPRPVDFAPFLSNLGCLYGRSPISEGLVRYCSSTKKRSHLDHCIVISQERKPLVIIAYSSTKTQSHLGSWHIHQPRNKDRGSLKVSLHTVHEPRNKATWIIAYSSTKKESHLGS